MHHQRTLTIRFRSDMDMTPYITVPTTSDIAEWKLKKHTKAIRERQVSVLYILAALLGYEVRYVGEPMPGFAKECLDEIGAGGTEAEKQAQIDIYSCSPTAGGIWTTPQRRMLFTGKADET